ncbi:TPA: paraquat-inducible protein A [Klebsiella pneumoniae]|nr:paraquat-inducible protein A [Klebsiella pneumoniae]
MPIKTPTFKPAKKMVVHTVSTPLPYAHYQRCTQCDMLFRLPVLKRNQSAWCPRCNAKVRDGRDWSLTRLGSMALAMLLLMPFAWSEPLLRLHLLGVRIDANVLQGIWQMTAQGDPITAAMVLFCAVVAPVLLVVSISYLWLGNVLGMNLRPVLLMLGKLKEWVMLDIYLVGIGVASIKVQDYAFLQPGIGLVAFISLTLLSILTLIHMNVLVFLFPANLLPISIIYVNGARQDDTILSGIISLASSNIAIAGVVFIASILVPFTKVIVLFTLLLSIQFKCEQGLRTRILLLRLITWIGRWSMLDLFVISLTMSLINRDQLLAFTMGPAAVYFGGAVILTILAVEWLDSRLLWDAHESGNARFAD